MLKGKIFLIILLLSACSTKPYVIKHAEEPTITGKTAVYVTSHGWHTGFVIPSQAIQHQIPELKTRFGNIPYIEFGWGDKGFYQAQEITTGLTLKAMFWPTSTVIHAVAVPNKVEEYFQHSEIEKICFNNKEYSLLVKFITDSFYKNKVGNVLELKHGIYGNSQFYKAIGQYYLFNTCNKWTAKGLKSAKMKIWPIFKLTASSVMNFIKKQIPSSTLHPKTISTQFFECKDSTLFNTRLKSKP